MNYPTLRQPTLFVPVAMSLIALALVIGHFVISGRTHEVDEGALAHVFQLLMVAQVPLVAYFAIKWLPRAPQRTLALLSVQIVAALAAMVSVLFLT